MPCIFILMAYLFFCRLYSSVNIFFIYINISSIILSPLILLQWMWCFHRHQNTVKYSSYATKGGGGCSQRSVRLHLMMASESRQVGVNWRQLHLPPVSFRKRRFLENHCAKKSFEKECFLFNKKKKAHFTLLIPGMVGEFTVTLQMSVFSNV